jgi:3-hydroxymyristoyl/3-hydroxydecanoyl-(acyl carrier protein) dehydratase
VNPNVHLTFVIPSTHPTLPGHFPGRPVVPGAIILSEVVHAATTVLPSSRITGFAFVKFSSPLLPEQTCELTLTDKGSGSASFELAHEGRRIASGQLRYEPRVTES